MNSDPEISSPVQDAEGVRDWEAIAAALAHENDQLTAELVRHGWTIDCTRCAALIDGADK